MIAAFNVAMVKKTDIIITMNFQLLDGNSYSFQAVGY